MTNVPLKRAKCSEERKELHNMELSVFLFFCFFSASAFAFAFLIATEAMQAVGCLLGSEHRFPHCI